MKGMKNITPLRRNSIRKCLHIKKMKFYCHNVQWMKLYRNKGYETSKR